MIRHSPAPARTGRSSWTPGGYNEHPHMSSQLNIETDALRVELDTERKIRARNKLHYRFNHWPIWIFVFFIAPGPLTFDLFERGFDQRLLTWLAVVLLGTGIAGLRGRLPGCEPAPY